GREAGDLPYAERSPAGGVGGPPPTLRTMPGSPAEAERQPGAEGARRSLRAGRRRADTQPTAAQTGVPLVVSSAAGHPRGLLAGEAAPRAHQRTAPRDPPTTASAAAPAQRR